MNDLMIFENPQGGNIRAINIDGEPWFVAVDVCKALELNDVGKAVSRLDADEGTRIEIDHPQNPTKKIEVYAVNEPGLYSLILGSRKPEAKAFKRWITHEVIPSIRKTGAYQVGERKSITIAIDDLSLIVGTVVAECIKQIKPFPFREPEPEAECEAEPVFPKRGVDVPHYSSPEYRERYMKNLNAMMRKRGMTQRDLCRGCCFRPASVSMWCNGYTLPRLDRQKMIADFFGVDPDFFFKG